MKTRPFVDAMSMNSGSVVVLFLIVKVRVLNPIQKPGSYWDRSSTLSLVGLEPTRGDSLLLDAKLVNLVC